MCVSAPTDFMRYYVELILSLKLCVAYSFSFGWPFLVLNNLCVFFFILLSSLQYTIAIETVEDYTISTVALDEILILSQQTRK